MRLLINSVLFLLLIIKSAIAFETTSESESEFSRYLSSTSAGDVSLFTGSVVLNIPLATINDGDNLSFPVNLHYSSNVYRTVRADNAVSPTDWVGLGWTLGWGSIICNHNNTAAHEDDQFFWKTSQGYILEIRRAWDYFYIESKPYNKVKPTRNAAGVIIGWTIIEPNGHKMLFGNFADIYSKATRYTYRWDWYVGDTRLLQSPEVNPVLYPYQWDLSEIQDQIGNSIKFKYDQATEGLMVNTCTGTPNPECNWQINDPALFYTKSSWPLSIESSTGGKIVFETTGKDAQEYVDPYTFSNEPDEFIEFYNTKLLTNVKVYTPDNILLKYFSLTYSKINATLSGNYMKSILTGVKEYSSGGTLFKHSRFDYNDDFEKGDDQNSTRYDSDYNYGALKSYRTNSGTGVTYVYKKRQIPFEATKQVTFSGLGKMTVSVGMRSNNLPFVCATNNKKLYVYNWDGSKWNQQTAVPETFFDGGTIDSVLATTDMFVVCGPGGKYNIYNWVRGEWHQSATRPTGVTGFRRIQVGPSTVGIEKDGPTRKRTIELHTWDRWRWHEKDIEFTSNWDGTPNSIIVGAGTVGYTSVSTGDGYQAIAYAVRWKGYGNEWTDGNLLHTSSSSMIYVLPLKNFCYSISGNLVRMNQWQGTKWGNTWVMNTPPQFTPYEGYFVDIYYNEWNASHHVHSTTWDGKIYQNQYMLTEMMGSDYNIKTANDYFIVVPTRTGTKNSYAFNWNKVTHQWEEKNGFNVAVSTTAELLVYDNMYILVDANNTSRTLYTYTWNGKLWKEQVFTNFVPSDISSVAGVGNALAFGYNDGVTLLFKYRDKFNENYETYCTERVLQADGMNGKALEKNISYDLSNATCNTLYGIAEFNKVSVSQPNAGSIAYEYHNHKTIDSYGFGGDIFVGKVKKQEVKNDNGDVINSNEYSYGKYHNDNWYSDQFAAELTSNGEKNLGVISTETNMYRLPGIAGKHGSPVSVKMDKQGKILHKIEVPAVDIPTYKSYLEDIDVNPSGKNMVAQKAMEVVLENPNSDVFTNSRVFSIIDKQYIRGATVTTWANNHNPLQAWMPCSTFAWYSDMDKFGVPLKNFQTFNFADPKSNSVNWKYLGANKLYNCKGKVIENEKPSAGKSVYIAYVYGHKANVLIATLANCSFKEGSVFTCDYNLGEDGFFDKENGWEKGIGNDPNNPKPNPTVELSAENMFGTKSVRVNNSWGPTRNCRLSKDKNYVMTAWVKVESGKAWMAADYRYKAKNVDNVWPLTGLTRDESAGLQGKELGPTSGKWVLMKLDIPAATVLKSKDWDNNNWYARTYVGSVIGGTVYVQDIRIAPKDAMVTSTYYDKKWYQPILSVDANNNPGKKVVYDDYGRLSEIVKIKKDDIEHPVLLEKKEYHLMGIPNIPPEVPSNLSVTVNYPQLTFKWNGGDFDDGQTIVYKINVVKFGGGSTIPITIRYISALASQKVFETTFTPASLPEGDYYWSISATDGISTVECNDGDPTLIIYRSY